MNVDIDEAKNDSGHERRKMPKINRQPEMTMNMKATISSDWLVRTKSSNEIREEINARRTVAPDNQTNDQTWSSLEEEIRQICRILTFSPVWASNITKNLLSTTKQHSSSLDKNKSNSIEQPECHKHAKDRFWSAPFCRRSSRRGKTKGNRKSARESRRPTKNKDSSDRENPRLERNSCRRSNEQRMSTVGSTEVTIIQPNRWVDRKKFVRNRWSVIRSPSRREQIIDLSTVDRMMFTHILLIVVLFFLGRIEQSKPVFIEQPQDLQTTIGSNVLFRCRTQYSDSNSVTWCKNDFCTLGKTRDLPFYPRYEIIGDPHKGCLSIIIVLHLLAYFSFTPSQANITSRLTTFRSTISDTINVKS